jgi:HEAT repeat protein
MPDTAGEESNAAVAVKERSTESLIANLGSKDGIRRQQARWELIRRKEASVGPRLESLQSKRSQIRWEAVKALAAIAPPRACGALIAAMQDEEWEVRWVAAEAVSALGRSALPQLLDALLSEPESVWLREGAHHVVHDLARGEYSDVEAALLRALGGFRSSEEVFDAARRMKAEIDIDG